MLDLDKSVIDKYGRAPIFLNYQVTGSKTQRWQIIHGDDEKAIINLYNNGEELRLDAFLEGTTDDTKVGCDKAVSGSLGQQWTTGMYMLASFTKTLERGPLGFINYMYRS